MHSTAMDATEDAASRRPAQPGGSALIVKGVLKLKRRRSPVDSGVMRLFASAVTLLAAAVLAGPAAASQLIDRNATGVHLSVSAKGEALLTYRAHGRFQHVLVWGAVDARQPTSGKPQVRFLKDYSGGYGKYRRSYWLSFPGGCRRYDGPALDSFVTACAAPDGSYWAVQAWRTPLPDLGMTPWLPVQRAVELHLSHWRGPIAKLAVWTDWVYGARYHQVFGRVTYDGQPLHGFTATRMGAPTDTYGRLVYLDTFNSRYGPGWKRENSFLAHNPTGLFCYGFFRFDPTRGYPHPAGYPSTLRGPGNGEEYRVTMNGPGVTPDISVTVPGLHDYNPANAADVAYERQQNALLDSILGVDKLCGQH